MLQDRSFIFIEQKKLLICKLITLYLNHWHGRQCQRLGIHNTRKRQELNEIHNLYFSFGVSRQLISSTATLRYEVVQRDRRDKWKKYIFHLRFHAQTIHQVTPLRSLSCFFKKFGSTLCSPYNFFFVPRCLQLLFTASDSGGSSAREQKNWRRLTSKRLINNTRKSSGMKWGTSVMALKRTQLVKRLFI